MGPQRRTGAKEMVPEETQRELGSGGMGEWCVQGGPGTEPARSGRGRTGSLVAGAFRLYPEGSGSRRRVWGRGMVLSDLGFAQIPLVPVRRTAGRAAGQSQEDGGATAPVHAAEGLEPAAPEGTGGRGWSRRPVRVCRQGQCLHTDWALWPWHRPGPAHTELRVLGWPGARAPASCSQCPLDSPLVPWCRWCRPSPVMCRCPSWLGVPWWAEGGTSAVLGGGGPHTQ